MAPVKTWFSRRWKRLGYWWWRATRPFGRADAWLEKNAWLFFLGGAIAVASTASLAIAFNDDWSPILGLYGQLIKTEKWLFLSLLLIVPTGAILRGGIRLIATTEARKQAKTTNDVISSLKRYSRDLGKHAEDVASGRMPLADAKNLICTYLGITFTLICSSEEDNMKVLLCEVKDGVLTDHSSFKFPAGTYNKTPIEELRNPKCTICLALKDKDTIIVEDIEAEVARGDRSRFLVTSNKAGAKGSLICHPVIFQVESTNSYVFSIYCSSRRVFEEANRNFYRLVLEFFAGQLTFMERAL